MRSHVMSLAGLFVSLVAQPSFDKRVHSRCVHLSQVLLAMAGLFQTAMASTYYVAPSGADTNAGTAEEPFLTIQRAAEVVRPGDKVLVRAGVYRETVVMKTSGEPERPIVFEGQRGPDGQWQTIVHRSVAVTGWVPAPEVGPGVYKTKSLGFAPYSMTLDGKQLARIRDDFMRADRQPEMRSGEGRYVAWWQSNYRDAQVGFGLLRTAPDAAVRLHYSDGELPYWDGVEALYGHRDGVTYIRFRNGDDPNGKILEAAQAGGGFSLPDKSHVVIRGFHVRGAQESVVIQGDKAIGNVVENNFLANGHVRVAIRGGASHNIIQNNEITLNYYGFDDPGAWATDKPDRRAAIRQHVYLQFKYTVGHNSSDDQGIEVQGGQGNVIRANHIYAGLIGVSCTQTRDVDVDHNVIHNMSSIGICTTDGVMDGRFHDNLVYDCNINLRIHQYNTKGDNQRREYHYRNCFYEPEGLGKHIFNHWWDGGMPLDTEHPQIFIYHNSFSGGEAVLTPNSFADKGGGMARTRILNNILSSPKPFSVSEAFSGTKTMLEVCDYNWVGGTLPKKRPAWFGEHNVDADGVRLWTPDAMPDFRLSENSPARGKGIDLAAPFTVNGKSYGPLPGMKRGYFRGSAPDLGAIQYGEPAAQRGLGPAKK